MKLAIITLSAEGARVSARLSEYCAARGVACDVYLHAGAPGFPSARRFDRVIDLTREIFEQYTGLIYVAPAGLVVRAIAPCIAHKKTDPGVVVVDVGGRWAVSLLAGHEGGANELANFAANAIGAEPVITTTTEAVKNLIVGIGCRKGTPAEAIVAAVGQAISLCGGSVPRVRLLATADVKAQEPGLLEAAAQLGVPLRIVPSDEIRGSVYSFQHSEFVQNMVDLPAVAEPAALLAGRRTRLLLPRTALGGVMVAVAREDCSSLA